jgi:hypothetical protein
VQKRLHIWPMSDALRNLGDAARELRHIRDMLRWLAIGGTTFAGGVFIFGWQLNSGISRLEGEFKGFANSIERVETRLDTLVTRTGAVGTPSTQSVEATSKPDPSTSTATPPPSPVTIQPKDAVPQAKDAAPKFEPRSTPPVAGPNIIQGGPEFYVVQDAKTKKCTVVAHRPTVGPGFVVGDGRVYPSRTEAESAVKTITTCKP